MQRYYQRKELQRITSAVLQQPFLLSLPGQTGVDQWLDSQRLFSGIFKIFAPRQCISPNSSVHFPTQSSLFPPIVQWLFGCIWHASVVAFLHLLSYTFSQWNSNFPGLNSNKWWGYCSAMTGLSPCVMGCSSLAADLLHICTCPHRRNKAINKRAMLGIFVSQSTGSEYRNA